jgi:hypothetical protein
VQLLEQEAHHLSVEDDELLVSLIAQYPADDANDPRRHSASQVLALLVGDWWGALLSTVFIGSSLGLTDWIGCE